MRTDDYHKEWIINAGNESYGYGNQKIDRLGIHCRMDTIKRELVNWKIIGGSQSEHSQRASLVGQWLRIRLPMQGTQVWTLVREDPTCRGATKPVRHNYWSLRAWRPCSATGEATAMRSPCTATKSSLHSLHLEKAHAQQRRPNTTKNK